MSQTLTRPTSEAATMIGPDEVQALRHVLARYVEEEVIGLEREHGLAWREAPPRDLRRQVRVRARELGLYGIDMPVSAGGGGIPFATRCELEMELHSHDTVFFEDVLGGGGGPTSILLAGTPAQQKRFLDPLMTGQKTTCFALSEPDAGSDAAALKTRATWNGDRLVLNGNKSIVSNGVQADTAIVFGLVEGPDGQSGVTSFLLDTDAPGYAVSRSHTCMGFTGFQGELTFSDVPLSEENILGQPGQGFALAMDWINGNRVRTAAMAAGIARRLLVRCASYAATRTQFGSPIAGFQAIQLKLADMATELFAAESMVRATASQRDQGGDIRKEAAMTKLYASEMVNRAAYEAVQIHGGAGCLEETGIERVYRMVRILPILEGTSEMQRLTVAERVLKQVAAKR